MDILACPYCKDASFPLKLIVIEEKRYPNRSLPRTASIPLCELYCGFKKSFIKDLKDKPPCDECIKIEVATGVLYCSRCGRWFPIIDEIPRMLPDDYRKEGEDLEFLRKYSHLLPDEIKLKGKPFNLGRASTK